MHRQPTQRHDPPMADDQAPTGEPARDDAATRVRLASTEAEMARVREEIRIVREGDSHEDGEGWYLAQREEELNHLERYADELRAQLAAPPPPPTPPPSPTAPETVTEDITGQYDDGHDLSWTHTTTPQPPPPGAPETGHYDDGHTFGWTQPAQPSEPTDPLDTGHYDDGHGFGWPSPPPPTRPTPSSGTVRWWLPVIGGVVLVVLVTVVGMVVLGGSGGSHESASGHPSTASSSTPGTAQPASPAVEATAPAAQTDLPIEVRSTCPEPCASEDSHCNFTFHWSWQLFQSDKQTPDTTHDGEQAVVATNGHGMRPRYQVAVGAGGQVVLDAVARGADWGGNRDNGCYVPGVTFAVALISVGGHPTSTPHPPA
jgi:hypothetical protein